MGQVRKLLRAFRYAACVAALAIVGCTSTSNRSTASTSADSLSVLEKASVAFDGSPSPASIKIKIDEALRLYNTPISDENYSRAASTLIGLREKNGVDEMAILDYMIKSHVEGANLTFPQAAAISATFLKVKGER